MGICNSCFSKKNAQIKTTAKPKPKPKSIPESILKQIPESIPEPISESIPEPISESIPEPIPEPITKIYSDPDSDPDFIFEQNDYSIKQPNEIPLPVPPLKLFTIDKFNEQIISCINEGKISSISNLFGNVYKTFIEICKRYYENPNIFVDRKFLKTYPYLFLIFPDSRTILLKSYKHKILLQTNDGLHTLFNSSVNDNHKMLLLTTTNGLQYLIDHDCFDMLYANKNYDLLLRKANGIQYIIDNGDPTILLKSTDGISRLYLDKYYDIMMSNPAAITWFCKNATDDVFSTAIRNDTYRPLFLICRSATSNNSSCKPSKIISKKESYNFMSYESKQLEQHTCNLCNKIYNLFIKLNYEKDLLTNDNACDWLANHKQHNNLLLFSPKTQQYLANIPNKRNILLLYSNNLQHLLPFDSKIYLMMELKSVTNIQFNIGDVKQIINILTRYHVICQDSPNFMFLIYSDDVKLYCESKMRMCGNGYDNNGVNLNKKTKQIYQDKIRFCHNGYDKNGYDKSERDEKYLKSHKRKQQSHMCKIKSDAHIFRTSDYNKDGYDLFGYNRDGYDCHGYGRDGYNIFGRDRCDRDRDGYNTENRDCDQYDRDGYYFDGRNSSGFYKTGLDQSGYNCEGYNINWYNKDGYNPDGFDKNGYDKNGYDCIGFDKNNKTCQGAYMYDMNTVHNLLIQFIVNCNDKSFKRKIKLVLLLKIICCTITINFVKICKKIYLIHRKFHSLFLLCQISQLKISTNK